jgi:hypothetical protein
MRQAIFILVRQKVVLMKQVFRRKVLEFISSEEAGVDAAKIVAVGGLAFTLLLGQAGAEYVPPYGHRNYVMHTNFVEFVEHA